MPENQADVIAIPMGGKRGKATAAKLKAEGARKGATDLIVILPAGATVWCEVKLDDTPLTKRTDLSASQRAFRAALLAKGHHHRVVRSIEQYHAVLVEFGVQPLARPYGAVRPAAAQ